MIEIKEKYILRTSNSDRPLFVTDFLIKYGYIDLLEPLITHVYEIQDDEIVLLWKRGE